MRARRKAQCIYQNTGQTVTSGQQSKGIKLQAREHTAVSRSCGWMPVREPTSACCLASSRRALSSSILLRLHSWLLPPTCTLLFSWSAELIAVLLLPLLLKMAGVTLPACGARSACCVLGACWQAGSVKGCTAPGRTEAEALGLGSGSAASSC